MRRLAGVPPVAVSVLTPTLPERATMLDECEASVCMQTSGAWEHLILKDRDREGCSVVMNRLARAAQGEWLLPLADDDLLEPEAIATLLAHSADADVVYSPPILEGSDGWWYFQEPPCIPSCALIHASLWRELGGYDETATREEDRKLWTLAVDAGARFVKVDAPMWTYRLHEGSKSLKFVSRHTAAGDPGEYGWKVMA